MSHNHHTLLLVFADPEKHRQCALALHHLQGGEADESRLWQEKLGVPLAHWWNDIWFNQTFEADSDHMVLFFETGTSEPLPLQLLHELFGHGLRAAALEVFYDQVGEMERRYYVADAQVNQGAFEAAGGDLAALAGRHFSDEEPSPVARDCPASPMPLPRLMAHEKEREAEARAAVEGFMELARVSRETGSNPLSVLKGMAVLWAVGKGLLHALIFTVVAVLLLKGFWIWIGVGALLALVLPLVYAAGALRDFRTGES